MAIFRTFFFLANAGKKNVFYDILEPKIAFQDYKNKRLKKSKNWHFSKGETHGFGPNMETHGFGPNMAIFPRFFF